ncbi:MAG TPA: zinc ribbon domain-containing protein [Candidatus Bathyarchaeia archaeon]|nr:zinc ribbon domain-containing protein [Candidatus Bathyarchaeia archaeon]
MPIYEYRCPNCGDFDVMQKITDAALKKCPRCKKAKLTKLISQTAFQLKGTGWYVTDYAGKGRGDAKAPKEGDGSSATGDGKPGDGKPASEGSSTDGAKGDSTASKSQGKTAAKEKSGKSSTTAAA